MPLHPPKLTTLHKALLQLFKNIYLFSKNRFVLSMHSGISCRTCLSISCLLPRTFFAFHKRLIFIYIVPLYPPKLTTLHKALLQLFKNIYLFSKIRFVLSMHSGVSRRTCLSISCLLPRTFFAFHKRLIFIYIVPLYPPKLTTLHKALI